MSHHKHHIHSLQVCSYICPQSCFRPWHDATRTTSTCVIKMSYYGENKLLSKVCFIHPRPDKPAVLKAFLSATKQVGLNMIQNFYYSIRIPKVQNEKCLKNISLTWLSLALLVWKHRKTVCVLRSCTVLLSHINLLHLFQLILFQLNMSSIIKDITGKHNYKESVLRS